MERKPGRSVSGRKGRGGAVYGRRRKSRRIVPTETPGSRPPDSADGLDGACAEFPAGADPGAGEAQDHSQPLSDHVPEPYQDRPQPVTGSREHRQYKRCRFLSARTRLRPRNESRDGS